MLSPELDENERRELVRMFVSPGWKILKDELGRRKAQLAKDLIYSKDREPDDKRRAGIVIIDMIMEMERSLFAPPSPDDSVAFQIPELPTGNRY